MPVLWRGTLGKVIEFMELVMTGNDWVEDKSTNRSNIVPLTSLNVQMERIYH